MNWSIFHYERRSIALRVVEGSSARPSYDAVATPVNYGSTGKRSFFLNQEGVIREADKKGAEATASDPVLKAP